MMVNILISRDSLVLNKNNASISLLLLFDQAALLTMGVS